MAIYKRNVMGVVPRYMSDGSLDGRPIVDYVFADDNDLAGLPGIGEIREASTARNVLTGDTYVLLDDWIKAGGSGLGAGATGCDCEAGVDPLPMIQRVMVGKPPGVGNLHDRGSYMTEPVIIHLDRPAPADCYIQPWRYSKLNRQNTSSSSGHGGPRTASCFRPWDLHQLSWNINDFKVPEGATIARIVSPHALYRPVKLRGWSKYFKPPISRYPWQQDYEGNPYCQINREYANKCRYKFSTAVYTPPDGDGKRLYRRGNPSVETLEIMQYVDGKVYHGSDEAHMCLIARIV